MTRLTGNGKDKKISNIEETRNYDDVNFILDLYRTSNK